MSKFDWKKLTKIGLGIGKEFAPKASGSIFDAVGEIIEDKDDPKNETALKVLADKCVQLEAACIELHGRVKKLEGK